MNKLVIIGNGFDLAHGMKTQYDEFIQWYLKKVFTTVSNNQRYEDDLVEAFRHRHVPLQKPEGNFPIYDFLRVYKTAQNYTFKFKCDFFERLLNQYTHATWIDIESFYYKRLVAIYKQIESSKPESLPHLIKMLREMNDCFDYIKRQLVEYLITIDNLTKEPIEDIRMHVKEDLYSNIERSRILIVVFNYTSTIDLYLAQLKPGTFDVIFIHGKLSDENNPIIFGYGDEIDSNFYKIEQLNENEFFRNIKSFGYAKTTNYQQLSNFLESSEFGLYIVGHSCGLSDRVLLNSIVEHKNCKRIEFFYHKISKNENDFINKAQELYRHFKPENKRKMRTILLPLSKSKPLVKCE